MSTADSKRGGVMDKMDVGLLAAMILAAPHLNEGMAYVIGSALIVLGMVFSVFFNGDRHHG